MRKKLSLVTVRVVLTSFLVLSAVPALAQIGKEPVEDAPQATSWMAFLFAIFFGIAVAVGCLMSPKRSHQD